jgi:class 3 adenylate cyclase
MLYSGVQAKEEAQKLMSDLPTGTVTFLFTDIEGSTKLWEKSPRSMQIALTRHDALLWEAIEGHGGFVFKTVGDAFCAVFPTALGVLKSALAAQRGLFSEAWGMRSAPSGRGWRCTQAPPMNEMATTSAHR